MKRILLTKGQSTLVDDQDYLKLKQYSWCYHSAGYAVHKKSTLMHRLIVGAKKGNYVDHINGNKLDNRKKNLRLITQSGNMFNQKIRKDNKSGLRGVTWDTNRLKWFASIAKNGKTIGLGRFESKKDAYRAYVNKAKELYGKEYIESARNGIKS